MQSCTYLVTGDNNLAFPGLTLNLPAYNLALELGKTATFSNATVLKLYVKLYLRIWV